MEQAATQTGDYTDYKALLQTQQGEFLKYVQEWFDFSISAPKRFQFLRAVQYKLDSIRLKYADIIQERNADFFRYWSLLITDTWQFVSIGVDTLGFQSNCTAQMLAEPEQSHTFPLCKWNAGRKDLMELIVGIYQTDAIRLQDGCRPSFALFAKAIGNVLGIEYHASFSLVFLSFSCLMPYSQTDFPHSQINFPSFQTDLPHSQISLPTSQTNLPHSQTDLPHSQINLPHSQTNLPHS
jgi:hypothetical protein